MTKYFNHGRTRALILPAVADLAEPTMAEIGAGVDITTDLWSLTIRPSTESFTRKPWRGEVEERIPTHHSAAVHLGGYRHTATADEILWPLCATFRATAFLLVRRGLLTGTSMAVGQRVEMYQGKWGRRGSAGSDGAGMFEVELFPSAMEDDAVVV